MSIGRTMGMIALACTGIGALYMLSRVQWVSPNSEGVVLNYYTNEYEKLEPGVHCLLNPMRSFQKEVSKQVQVKRLNPFSVKSFDNVDSNVQIDVTFQFDNPTELYRSVRDPENTFFEMVKTACSSAIQTLNFSHATSAELNRLVREASIPEREDQHLVSGSEAKDSQHTKREGDGVGEAELLKDGASFFKSLLAQCRQWGVTIKTFSIVSFEAKHQTVSQALELTAQAEVKAKADAKAANSQANTIRTLAQAHKDAEVIRAEGAVLAAKKLEDAAAELKDPNKAMEVFALENRVRVAKALGGSGNLLVSTDPNARLSENAFATFSSNNGSLRRVHSDGAVNNLGSTSAVRLK